MQITTFLRPLCLALALALPLTQPGAAIARDVDGRPQGFADLAERLLPAVVNISTTQKLPDREDAQQIPQFPPGSPFEDFFKDFFDRQGPAMPQQRATSLGSGFILDSEKGYVVTNNHVIADADEITVILQDDTNLSAQIVGRDTKTDLAVLKVDTSIKLPHVEFGNSDAMRVGDWVVAIGNPFGLGGTVTAGIISARARNINAGPYDDFLQTDASINRGNSGGPMFNLDGQVIGINTAIFSPTGGSIGIGFAIPANLARPVIDQLIKFGRTRRGWLGVRIQDVTAEIADSLQLDSAQGALVASVNPGGPAEKAGIEAGDIILQFNGQDVTAMHQLPRIVAETPIDESVPVQLWRKGKKVFVKVNVGELEAAEESGLLAGESADKSGEDSTPAGTQVEELGLELSAITPELRERFGIDDDLKGVVVTGVKGDSPAADKGVQPGDVILEVNQNEVGDPAAVQKHVDSAQKGERRNVLLLIDRKGEIRFVALTLKG